MFGDDFSAVQPLSLGYMTLLGCRLLNPSDSTRKPMVFLVFLAWSHPNLSANHFTLSMAFSDLNSAGAFAPTEASGNLAWSQPNLSVACFALSFAFSDLNSADSFARFEHCFVASAPRVPLAWSHPNFAANRLALSNAFSDLNSVGGFAETELSGNLA